MSENKPLIPGVKIVLAGQEYILPPITLGQLRAGVRDKMRKNDELVAKGADSPDGTPGDTEAHWEALHVKSQIIAEALRRNYPDLSDEQVESILDLGNYDKAWEIVMGGSGFRAQAIRNAVDEGVVARTLPPPKTNGILDPYTAPSFDHTDGPTETLINSP